MIEVENITKTYGEARGVNNVSFTVDKGEILGFLGPNGAGKTTIMRILTCFMPATSGKARVGGYDVFEDSLKVRSCIGYLPETVPLYTDMQVPLYLRYVAGLKGIPWKDINSKVDEMMERVGLTHMAHKFIGELSKGYRQRVGLAQALVNDPKVLILDEPTIGLDPKQIIEIRSLIKGLAGERTVILSTHILPEVTMICKKVIIIDEGQIKAMDTPDNLIKRLHATCRVLVRIAGPLDIIHSKLSNISGVNKVERQESGEEATHSFIVEFSDGYDGSYHISRIAAEHKWDLYELTPSKMSLEDIFIKIVTEEKV